jgi:hypothetical protein
MTMVAIKKVEVWHEDFSKSRQYFPAGKLGETIK